MCLICFFNKNLSDVTSGILKSSYPYLSKYIYRLICFFFYKFLRRGLKKYKKLMRKIYSLTEKRPMRIYRRKYKYLSALHLTFLFYINLKHRNFQMIAKKAKKKDGFFEENYLLLLEGRLVAAVYRSSMILNLFDSINFVKGYNVTVNGLLINHINYVVPIMKIIGFRIIYKG